MRIPDGNMVHYPDLIVRWFGKNWGGGLCHPAFRVPVPVGRHCVGCGELFKFEDRGVSIPPNPMASFHLKCWMENLFGPMELWTPIVRRRLNTLAKPSTKSSSPRRAMPVRPGRRGDPPHARRG
jgi:hypothetical protein